MVRARAPHLLSTMARPSRPASPQSWSPRSTMTEASRADRAQQDRVATDPAPTRPASSLGRIARPASTRTEIEEVPPRSEPPPSSWTSPPTIDPPSTRSTPFHSPSPEGARGTRVDPAAKVARSPGAPLTAQEPMRWRWRIESADKTTRRRSDASLAQREAIPERPPDPRSTAVRTPVPHQPVPAPWRASTPDAPSCAAPILRATPRAVVRAELSRPTSIGAAPPRVPSSTQAGVDATRAPTPAVTPTGAAPSNEPPPRSFDHARDALSRPDWGPRPPARPGLWPRLPDEDEHDSPPQTRPSDPTWPVLPSDDLAALEAPVHGEDRARSDHLRREQQGARWSERHS
jgi:hypothetical protein